MWTKLILAAAACLALPQLTHAQDAKATIDGVVKAMGDVKSVQYSGSGAYFSFGQAYAPGTAWPRFGVKSWTRTVDYETPAMRDEFVRADGDPTARGGGAPLAPNTKATQAVSGKLAWNQVGENPPGAALTAVNDRLYQVWMTPHGFIKAAAKFNATAETKTDGGKKVTTLSIAAPGQLKMKGQVNDKNLVEKVEAWTTSPVQAVLVASPDCKLERSSRRH